MSRKFVMYDGYGELEIYNDVCTHHYKFSTNPPSAPIITNVHHLVFTATYAFFDNLFVAGERLYCVKYV